MAALYAILKALRQAVQSDLGTLESIKVNNFFLFVLMLVYGALNSGQSPHSAEPFMLVLGFLLLFPLSGDPLARIPRERLALWPLSKRQRFALRLTSMALSPIAWLAVLVLLKTAQAGATLGFVAVALGVQYLAVASRNLAKRSPHGNLLRYIPRFPGPLGGLVRKDCREMLSLLDFYMALPLAVGGGIYRWRGDHPDPAAFAIIGLLVALALSTYAQALFGLDHTSGITRYRLMPLRGWQILLAKDLAFLGILLVLLLPLDPWPGLTFGLTALAIGHHSSVYLDLPQQRWRFAGGRLLPVGALQGLLGMAAGFAEHERGGVVLLLAGAGWVVSVFYYGRAWDRSVRSP